MKNSIIFTKHGVNAGNHKMGIGLCVPTLKEVEYETEMEIHNDLELHMG